jgi:hypothetical protein
MATQDFDPNRAQNLPEIEKQMAVKCVEQVRSSLRAMRESTADEENTGTNIMVAV